MVLAQSSGFSYLGAVVCEQAKGLSKSLHSLQDFRTQQERMGAAEPQAPRPGHHADNRKSGDGCEITCNENTVFSGLL